MELAQKTITELRTLLLDNEISPKDILEDLSQAIVQRDSLIQGYLSYDLEHALSEAESANLELPLGGIPIAIKDIINVEGQPCTCGSASLAENYRSPYNATAIDKLRQAGAIPFGKTNMDEFAMGSSTENSAFYPTKNPWDTSRVPGGSSGGSAAVVSADTAIAALGTDTGGSVRQPAGFCGCVGLRPTYGRISRYGVVAFASSLDQIGPLTKTAEDAALLMNALAGDDPRDSTALALSKTDFLESLHQGIRGLRIGLPREYFSEHTDKRITETVKKAVTKLEELGAEIIDISLPLTEYVIAVYYILAPAEASSNLARFDGVRYGHRTEEATDILSHYKQTRSEGFGDEVKRRMVLGTYFLSSGYYEELYHRAQKARTLIRQDFERAFTKVDVIASPMTAHMPFKIGEYIDDPLQMYLSDLFAIGASLAGVCALNVPCGFIDMDERELPVGMQLIGKPFAESTLLQTAHAYEEVTSWKEKKPTL